VAAITAAWFADFPLPTHEISICDAAPVAASLASPRRTLRPGDYLEMFVTVNQPAYVYVVQFFADGTSAGLDPDAGDRLLQPGSEVRIPEAADDLFQLDERIGDENVYVLMSREPASKADAMIASQIDQIRVSGAEPVKQEPPKQEPPQQDPAKQEPPKQEPPRSSTAVAVKHAGKPARPREDRFPRSRRVTEEGEAPDGTPTVAGTADKRVRARCSSCGSRSSTSECVLRGAAVRVLGDDSVLTTLRAALILGLLFVLGS
jgi:hypothetical protein